MQTGVTMRRTLIAVFAGSALVLSACSGLSARTDTTAQPLAFPSSSPAPAGDTSVEQVRAIPGISGVHLMSIRNEEALLQVIEDAGFLPRPGPGDGVERASERS